jgi:hypothetical protein
MSKSAAPRPSGFRRLKHAVTALLTLGFLTAALAAMGATSHAAAPSDPPSSSAPGDNGTIKTHNLDTPQDSVIDEPKVCAFYLDAFFFDGVQSVSWTIVQGTQGPVVLSGTISLDANGHGVTGTETLPNGMYKLTWSIQGGNGQDKHKVFTVDCAESSSPPPSSSSTSSSSPPPPPSSSISETGGSSTPVITETVTETGGVLPTGVNAGSHTWPASSSSTAAWVRPLALGLGAAWALWMALFYLVPLMRRPSRH